MSRTIPLEISSDAREQLIRQAHSFALEMGSLALRAPDGRVLDLLESAAVEGGREPTLAALEAAVRKRIDDAEKKAPDCGPAPAGGPARTAPIQGDAVADDLGRADRPDPTPVRVPQRR